MIAPEAVAVIELICCQVCPGIWTKRLITPFGVYLLPVSVKLVSCVPVGGETVSVGAAAAALAVILSIV